MFPNVFLKAFPSRDGQILSGKWKSFPSESSKSNFITVENFTVRLGKFLCRKGKHFTIAIENTSGHHRLQHKIFAPSHYVKMFVSPPLM